MKAYFENPCKRVQVWIFLLLLGAVLCMVGCAKGGGVTVKPGDVDWQKTSQYYHDYVAGFIAPIGGLAATVIAPETAPAVALAVREVGQLDKLIAAKANNESIASQAAVVQTIIKDVNQAVGNKS